MTKVAEPFFSLDMSDIKEVIGVNNAIDLMRLIGGKSFYIPKPDSSVVGYYKEKTGKTNKEVARDLKLTTRTVKKALKDFEK